MKKLIFILMLILSASGCQQSQPDNYHANETAEERAQRMAWFKEARFGMFIHWGLYAVPAGIHNGEKIKGIGEWIMNNGEIPIKEYETYADHFNPVKYDADTWVKIAKEAGMKYIVITSKHHDGFCLWDSKITKWDIMDATPFGRDILKELSEACEQEGIKLCFYHSIMDWHHPQAQAIWEPNYNRGRKDTEVNPEFPQYIENYMKPQLKELLTNYGNIGILWFDGEWVPDYTTEMGKEIYNYVRHLQPDIIINNRVDKGRKGMEGLDAEGDFAGDYGTPEQEIPDTGIEGVDWESCMTMNDTWGYKSDDHHWKSDKELIHNLIDIVSKGGNFLLNVGPTAEGLIPQPSADRLKKMGEWMAVNSESIYGSSASPFEKPQWGRYTQKDNKLFAHVFDWPKNKKLVVPVKSEHIEKVYLLSCSDEELRYKATSSEIQIALPEIAPDKIASVIVIKKEKNIMN